MHVPQESERLVVYFRFGLQSEQEHVEGLPVMQDFLTSTSDNSACMRALREHAHYRGVTSDYVLCAFQVTWLKMG